MLLPQDTDLVGIPELGSIETPDNKYQIVPESQTSKFIRNLGSDIESDIEVVGEEVIEYLEILTTPEETKLAEALDKIYKRYISFKNARLDTTRVDYPRYRTLHFIAYTTDNCCIHHNIKENAYFLRYTKPIYISRTTH